VQIINAVTGDVNEVLTSGAAYLTLQALLACILGQKKVCEAPVYSIAHHGEHLVEVAPVDHEGGASDGLFHSGALGVARVPQLDGLGALEVKICDASVRLPVYAEGSVQKKVTHNLHEADTWLDALASTSQQDNSKYTTTNRLNEGEELAADACTLDRRGGWAWYLNLQRSGGGQRNSREQQDDQ
jgi:hypothetical protein